MSLPSQPASAFVTRTLTWGCAAAVGLAAFWLYTLRTLLNPYLLDSAELAAASFGLGVAHPPGQSLSLLLGKLITFLPLGSVAFRVGLLQAACGACAAVCVYIFVVLSCGELPVAIRPGVRVRAPLAACGALVFAASPGAIDVSSRPEVYALATLLALLTLLCAQRAMVHGDARWAVVAAFLLGLGLTNHPLIAGTTGVAAVIVALPLLHGSGWREILHRCVAAVLALLMGLLVLLYVPLRAMALLGHPDAHSIVWGDARSVSGLWWVLSARTFADKNSLVQTSADPSSLPFLLFEEVGVVAMAFSLLGIYALARGSAAGRWRALGLMTCAAGAAAAGLLGGLDPHNPDVRGYLGAAFAVASVLAAVGAAAAVARIPGGRLRATAAVLAGLALLAGPIWRVARENVVGGRAGSVAEALLRQSVSSLAPRTALLTGHFETGFLLAYQRLVEGHRPDVAWAHMGFAAGPGYQQRMLASAPELAPLFVAHAQGAITANAIEHWGRPLAVEASVPVDAQLVRALSYNEGLWHWPPIAPRAEPTGVEPWMIQAVGTDRAARGFLTLRMFQDARLACAAHHPMAPVVLAKARQMMPEDKLILQLTQSCGAGAFR